MRITHRFRAMRTALKTRTHRFLHRFSVEEFLRDAVLKDLELLRSKYHRKIPAYVTASDLAACLELHGMSDRLISDHFLLDGVYMTRAESHFEVCDLEGGRRLDTVRYVHLHAASIAYMQRLIAAVDRTPGESLTPTGSATAEVRQLKKAPTSGISPRLSSSTPEREAPRVSSPKPLSTAARRAHLRVIH